MVWRVLSLGKAFGTTSLFRVPSNIEMTWFCDACVVCFVHMHTLSDHRPMEIRWWSHKMLQRMLTEVPSCILIELFQAQWYGTFWTSLRTWKSKNADQNRKHSFGRYINVRTKYQRNRLSWKVIPTCPWVPRLLSQKECSTEFIT